VSEKSAKWVCIHGHFYQPPRENPWLEAIEPQPSAHPYRDWNERITAECYRPNTAARVVDGQGHIIKIVDNYERMSFNVGPTLMSWLEKHARDVHDSLVAADRASRTRFGGHGSAMAQAYNHIIMPLASPRDKVTQV
jgi:alpha-amylase/alpha-mannosidase (GH57 family)